MKLCFATNNKHKIAEVARAIGGRLEIISLSEIGIAEELPETQETFEGNALQKAMFVHQQARIVSFADDSGLEVDALNGAPGVRSARYAGSHRNDDDNIDLVLRNLKNAPSRKANFRTVIALVGLGDPKFFEGRLSGQIVEARRGTNGFGYDPIFLPDGQERTFGEMTLEEKNALSHRAIATRKLIDYLNQIAMA